jgi:hypothetical protein
MGWGGDTVETGKLYFDVVLVVFGVGLGEFFGASGLGEWVVLGGLFKRVFYV